MSKTDDYQETLAVIARAKLMTIHTIEEQKSYLEYLEEQEGNLQKKIESILSLKRK